MKQYDNSPIISKMLADMAQYLTVPADEFYNKIWNVETAQGFGLDIWGRIVGIGRIVQIPVVDNYFGFNSGVASWEPFNQGVFNSVSNTVATTGYELADDAYRLLILTKAFANISATTAPAINQLLQILFAGRGRCYVNDLGDMAMRYTFEFTLLSWEFVVLTNGSVLPRPAGVYANLIAVEPPVFGFDGSGEPFNQGVFNSIRNYSNVA